MPMSTALASVIMVALTLASPVMILELPLVFWDALLPPLLALNRTLFPIVALLSIFVVFELLLEAVESLLEDAPLPEFAADVVAQALQPGEGITVDVLAELVTAPLALALPVTTDESPLVFWEALPPVPELIITEGGGTFDVKVPAGEGDGLGLGVGLFGLGDGEGKGLGVGIGFTGGVGAGGGDGT